MRRATPKNRTRRNALAAVIAGALGVGFSGSARADIRLVSPAPWIVETPTGDPQKAAPCGIEPNACFAPSARVTTYFAGELISVEWQETVAYDSYYRIAVSYDESHADLSEPPRNAFGDGGVLVDAGPPVAPILIDDVFPHIADSTSLPNDDTYNLLQLPDRPCSRCTLQVIQVLASGASTPPTDPSQYVFHQCADIVILPVPDGGSDASGYGATSIADAAPDHVCESDAAGTLGPDAGPVEDAHAQEDAATTMADATVGDGGGAAGDDGGMGTIDAGAGAANNQDAASSKGGCGCSVLGAPGSRLSWFGSTLACAMMFWRRRRNLRSERQAVGRW